MRDSHMPCRHGAQWVRSEGATSWCGSEGVCYTRGERPTGKVMALQRAVVHGDVWVDARVEQQLDRRKHAVLTAGVPDDTGLPEVLRVLCTKASRVDCAVVMKDNLCALERIGLSAVEFDCAGTRETCVSTYARRALGSSGPRTVVIVRKPLSSAGHERIVQRSVTLEGRPRGVGHVGRRPSIDKNSHACEAAK